MRLSLPTWPWRVRGHGREASQLRRGRKGTAQPALRLQERASGTRRGCSMSSLPEEGALIAHPKGQGRAFGFSFAAVPGRRPQQAGCRGGEGRRGFPGCFALNWRPFQPLGWSPPGCWRVPRRASFSKPRLRGRVRGGGAARAASVAGAPLPPPSALPEGRLLGALSRAHSRARPGRPWRVPASRAGGRASGGSSALARPHLHPSLITSP